MQVKLDGLNNAINQELTIYSSEIVEIIKKETSKSMKKLVDQTKKTAPKGTRQHHYKDNIKSRKVYENERAIATQWYVDGSDYRLSHLLENGHATRNGGRTEGTHFIANATTEVLTEYQKNVEEAVKNGI